MNVRELREVLAAYPDDMRVVTSIEGCIDDLHADEMGLLPEVPLKGGRSVGEPECLALVFDPQGSDRHVTRLH